MKKFVLGLILGAVIFTAAGAAEVKAVDYETALALQAATAQLYNEQMAAQQAALAAQQQAYADAVAAQQAALAAQQKQQQAALAAAQKQQQEALAAQAAAQAQAMEAANQIAAANMITPQVDTICDTNCAEQNARLYGQRIPDFVLVDISEQRVVFYRNGQRILGDNCVTGDTRRKHDTTVGIHKIIFMDTNRTLRGSYGEAFVKYWMRFTSGGQGLHDAGWRNQFGKQIYVTNGSHGCVNLPRTTAQTIYNNAYLGMFVIVEN